MCCTPNRSITLLQNAENLAPNHVVVVQAVVVLVVVVVEVPVVLRVEMLTVLY